MHFLARNTDRVEQRARAMEMVWEDMRDIWVAEEEQGLKRGTAAWTYHINHATLRTKKNYEKIIKSPVYHDFLQEVGVYAYWRNGMFLNTTFLTGSLMRHQYGGVSDVCDGPAKIETNVLFAARHSLHARGQEEDGGGGVDVGSR